MTELDMLIIRACKSGDHRKRLESIYKRYWYRQGGPQWQPVMAAHIGRLVDKHNPMDMWTLLTEIDPHTQLTPGIDSYWLRVVDVLVNRIRFTSRDNFPDMVWPAWSRKRDAEWARRRHADAQKAAG